MSGRIWIFSTLTASQNYTTYAQGGADLPLTDRQILIRGGANLADKHIITPRGVATEVTEEQYAVLQTIDAFQQHLKGGFLSVSKTKPEEEVAAADLNSRDDSAPLTPQDYVPGDGQAAPAETEETPVHNVPHASNARQPSRKA